MCFLRCHILWEFFLPAIMAYEAPLHLCYQILAYSIAFGGDFPCCKFRVGSSQIFSLSPISVPATSTHPSWLLYIENVWWTDKLIYLFKQKGGWIKTFIHMVISSLFVLKWISLSVLSSLSEIKQIPNMF